MMLGNLEASVLILDVCVELINCVWVQDYQRLQNSVINWKLTPQHRKKLNMPKNPFTSVFMLAGASDLSWTLVFPCS